MSQFLRPIGDPSINGWVPTNASAGWQATDDTSAAPNDTDYVSSPSNPTGSAQAVTLTLSNGGPPPAGTTKTLRVRSRKAGGKSLSGTILWRRSGTTIVSSIAPGTTTAFTTVAVGTTTDPADLIGTEFQAYATASGGGSPTTFDISVVEVETADVPVPATPSAAPTVTPGVEQVAVDFVQVAGTSVEAQFSLNGGSSWLAMTSGYTSTSYTLNQASPTLEHVFRYRRVSPYSGPGGWSPTSSPVVPSPAAPTGVTASPGPNKATITADTKTYPAKFKVYRGLAGGARSLVFTSALLNAGTALSWVDTGVVNGTAYDYHVTVEPQTPTVRESAASSVVTVTPSNAVTYTPIAATDDGTAGDFAGYFNTSSNLFFGNDLIDGVYRNWIRFPGLAVAQGETVPTATLRLCVKTTQNNGNNFPLFAAFVTVDNASNPSYAAGLLGLPYDNTNRVDFVVLDASPTDTYIDLDVTAGLQAIVNRPGWVSGNAVEIVIVDNGTPAGTVGSFASVGYTLPWRPQLIVDMTPLAPPEIHTTSGSATGVRSTTATSSKRAITSGSTQRTGSVTAVTSKRAITAANATGIRSMTSSTTTRRTTAANAAGIRSVTSSTTTRRTTAANAAGIRAVTATVTTTRTTVGSMSSVHSVTSVDSSTFPEIHTTTGSATRVGSVTAVTAKRAITSGSTQRTGSVTAVTTTRRTTAANAAATRSLTAVTTTVRTQAGSTQRTGSVTWSTTSRRTTAADAAGIRSVTRTGSSTRTTAGQMVSVHTVTAQSFGNGEVHTSTGSATMLHTTLSSSSKLATSAGNAAGVRSVTSSTTTRRTTSANAPAIRTVAATTTTRRTTTGAAQAVVSLTATTSRVAGTAGQAQLKLDASWAVSTVRTAAGTADLTLGMTWVIRGAFQHQWLLPGTAVLDSQPPATAVLTPAGAALATVTVVPAATSTVTAEGPALAVVTPEGPGSATVAPAGAATAILDPVAAGTATLTQE